MADENLIRAINELRNEIARMRNGTSFAPERGEVTSFVRDGMEDGSTTSANLQFRQYQQAIEKQSKAMKDMRQAHQSVFKSMLDGVPILSSFRSTVKSASEKVAEYSKGQSEAYKESAKASSDFAQKMSGNTDSLIKFQRKIEQIYESSQKVAEFSKKRQQLENEVTKEMEKFSMQNAQIAQNYSNIQDIIDELKKKQQKANKESRERYQPAIDKLEQLSSIPDEIEKLRNNLSDQELKDFIQKNPQFKKLLDSFSDIADQNKTFEEVVASVDDLTEVNDRLRGTYDGIIISNNELSKSMSESAKAFRQAAANLGRAIAAAAGEAITKEGNLLMTRQRLTGTVMGYAAREQALRMGMSETDLLTAMAENRFNIRGIARESGLAMGAGDFLSSGQLNQLTKLSREMGFMGKEALDNLIQVSDQLRVIGVQREQENIAGMMSYYSDTFKELGITVEQMRDYFAEMTQQGMLRTMLSGGARDGRFAAIEAIQEEVEYRGKLARVLNQELDVQQKRVQELSQLAYGDPASAIRRSIGMAMLGEQTGLSQQDQNLLMELIRTGGQSMGTMRRRRAINVRERLQIDVGGLFADAARNDDIGMRMLLSQFSGMAGIDAMEAVRSFERLGNRNFDLNTDIMGAPMATTREPSRDINRATNIVVDQLETLQGALQSSIGVSTSAIVSAIGALAMSGFMGGIAGRRAAGKGLFKGRGGAVKRLFTGAGDGGFLKRAGRATMTAGKIGTRFAGPVGAAVGTTMTINKIARGERIGTGEAALTGAGVGAGLGSFFGIPGIVAGTVIGAGTGAAGQLILGDQKAEMRERFINLEQATGGFGRGEMMETTRERLIKIQEEMDKAAQAGNITKFESLQNQKEAILASPEYGSIASNMYKFSNLENKEMQGKTNFISGFNRAWGRFRGKTNPALQEAEAIATEKGIYAQEITDDLENFMKSEDFMTIFDKGILQNMKEFLEENDIEDDQHLIDMLDERLAELNNTSVKTLNTMRESLNLDKRQYSDMTEAERREFIERRLQGAVSARLNQAIIGAEAASEHSR